MTSLPAVLRHALAGRAGSLLGALTVALLLLSLLPERALFASLRAYLGFHTLVELVCIIVALLVPLSIFNGYRQPVPGPYVVMGTLFALSGLGDVLHVLTMEGMPGLFRAGSLNQSIYFWLIARLFAISGLLALGAMPLREWGPARVRLVVTCLTLVGLVLLYGGFRPPGHLPALFVPGQGLTPLKVEAEWGLALLSLCAGAALLQGRAPGDRNTRRLLAVAAWITALAEICFTLYSTATDEFNVIGHVYKAISYTLVFRAVFLARIRAPYQALEEARHALADQEQRWQLALTGSATGVWDQSPQQGLIHTSREFARLLGYETQGLPHQLTRFRELVHPDDRERVRRSLQDHLAGRTDHWRSEHRLLDSRGEWRWLLVNGRIMATDTAGHATRVVGAAIDIQAGKEREQELGNVRSRLQAIFDMAPMGLVVFDEQGRLEQHNTALQRLLGEASDQAPQEIWQLVGNDQRPAIRRHWQRWQAAVADGDTTPFRHEISLAGHHPAPLWTRWLITPLPDGHHLGVIEDISNQRQAITLLQENAELYRSTFESGNAIKLLIDPDNNRIVDANPAAVEYYDYPLATLRRLHLDELVMTPLEVIRERIQRSLEHGGSHFESRHLGRDGQIREVEVFTAPITLGGRRLIYEMVHDISARKQAENELHLLNQRLARYGENRRHLNQLSARLYGLTDPSDLPALLEQELPGCFPEVCGELALRFEELEGEAHRIHWGSAGCEQHVFHHEERLESAAGAIGKLTLRGTPEDDEDRARLERMASDAARAMTLAVINLRLRQQLTRDAYRDALTGLYNRRHLEAELPGLLSRATSEQPLSLVLLDLDHFKQLNDTWGHDIGDEVLRAIARLMEGMLRTSDIACRYGGEEFVVAMPGASAAVAERRLGMILERFRDWRLTVAGGVIEQRSFSAGLVEAPHQGSNMTQLLEQADRALYRAKRAGRARIVVAAETD
ncbi:PAS domain S-box-containing protein/diguanylate cyclase (GGDEF)-like protein [Kushneria sinocarnis]|uniref:PAS domain S-box-containing protein/diguanylate cyclase (GGDEF)-like protein n=1 Tax=Kushneria sinocarnis TaxID=595502 RepID=A0A420WU02_9GAMM|nr:MASE3 domain-containing protein [Kushneria sinocarnis]RKQ96918.1 PAS domain S-box-containing protein/diguanylate cyclase (GGDEF)-like protein [Kushneria sinocarnis]